jgi:hypothetical protein
VHELLGNAAKGEFVPTKPVISNMVNPSLLITARSGPSQRMLRLLSGFCNLPALM